MKIGQGLRDKGFGDLRGRQYWLGACAGAVVIGVTLPTLLVCFHAGRQGVFWALTHGPQDPVEPPPWSDVAGGWVALQAIATVACGPGAVVLALLLYRFCKGVALWPTAPPLQHVVRYGMALGAVMAFLNFPGYLVGLVLDGQRYPTAKVALLFVVAGASAGMWIAWQAYRAAHPKERFWPRYSLATLLLVVFAWGLLLMVFAPDVK
ncbi:MAG: hypothetical protein NTW87_04290 [Planctomycetota bacterium]|nr:hypothetical protein [Planctomycetota bacterium]